MFVNVLKPNTLLRLAIYKPTIFWEGGPKPEVFHGPLEPFDSARPRSYLLSSFVALPKQPDVFVVDLFRQDMGQWSDMGHGIFRAVQSDESVGEVITLR